MVEKTVKHPIYNGNIISSSLILTALGVLLLFGLVVGACRQSEKWLEGGKLIFEDTFSDNKLSSHWKVGRVEGPASKGGGPRSPVDAAGHWTIRDGHLSSPGERNLPLWLDKQLPDNVRIEFEAWSNSDVGDIKIELNGDGELHESGYILVFGGWNNTMSIIGRLDEHEKGRLERADFVEKGRKYSMAVVRVGKELRWYIDGQLYMRRRDPAPLKGDGHQFFAFNNWRSHLGFENLKVFDLDAQN